jgi:medium-chain acyl-[acyl-carrier-protein] hydrolase
VYGVQLPGRGDRFGEPPFTRLAPLVEAVVDHIGPLVEEPLALFGHCMGALVAFEVARSLHRRGREPIHLIVSALPPPPFVQRARPLHHLPAREFLAAVSGLNGIPPGLASPEFLQLMLPALRADFELCETYSYRRGLPLACRISAYGGRQDPRSPPDLIGGWRDETSGRFTSRLFPGDHFFIDTARSAVLSAIAVDLLGTLFGRRAHASA